MGLSLTSSSTLFGECGDLSDYDLGITCPMLPSSAIPETLLKCNVIIQLTGGHTFPNSPLLISKMCVYTFYKDLLDVFTLS